MSTAPHQMYLEREVNFTIASVGAPIISAVSSIYNFTVISGSTFSFSSLAVIHNKNSSALNGHTSTPKIYFGL